MPIYRDFPSSILRMFSNIGSRKNPASKVHIYIYGHINTTFRIHLEHYIAAYFYVIVNGTINIEKLSTTNIRILFINRVNWILKRLNSMALVTVYSDKIEIITRCSSSRQFLDLFSFSFFFPRLFWQSRGISPLNLRPLLFYPLPVIRMKGGEQHLVEKSRTRESFHLSISFSPYFSFSVALLPPPLSSSFPPLFSFRSFPTRGRIIK